MSDLHGFLIDEHVKMHCRADMGDDCCGVSTIEHDRFWSEIGANLALHESVSRPVVDVECSGESFAQLYQSMDGYGAGDPDSAFPPDRKSLLYWI